MVTSRSRLAGARGAIPELTVIAVHAPAVPDRRPAAVAFARALEPKRQIQDNSPPLRHPEVRTRRSWVSLEGWSAGVLRGPLRGHLRDDASHRAEPAEMHRIALARQQRDGLLQRQSDHAGVRADDFHDEGAGKPLDGIAAGLAAPFA